MMDANNEDEKPNVWLDLQHYIYNPRTKLFFGRNAVQWLQVLVFYTIYYSAMIGFFVAAITLFLKTVPHDVPKWKLGESLIGTQPGQIL